jgi:hypothetical protein
MDGSGHVGFLSFPSFLPPLTSIGDCVDVILLLCLEGLGLEIAPEIVGCVR